MQENRTNNNSIIEEMKKNIPADGADLETNKGQTIENNTPSNNIKIKDKRWMNLKPYNPDYNNHLTTEEAQKRGRAGGLKSGEIRKARKSMRETLIDMLATELEPAKLEEMGIDTATLNGDYTLQSAVLASMLREAINGSERAAVLIRDTIGEQPITRTENRTEIITPEDLQTIDNLRKYLTG